MWPLLGVQSERERDVTTAAQQVLGNLRRGRRYAYLYGKHDDKNNFRSTVRLSSYPRQDAEKDVHVPQSETASSYTDLVSKLLNRIECEETATA
jgi:hypothetical protein